MFVCGFLLLFFTLFVQTTQTWKVSVLRWLILDEVDRLLDMGFGPQIAAILEEFRIRGVPRDQYRTIVTSVGRLIRCAGKISCLKRLGELPFDSFLWFPPGYGDK